MKTVVFGGVTARLLGGSDGNGAGDGPLVVLCHGFGAPGDDLVSLGPALLSVPQIAASKARFLFPHAVVDLGPEHGGGRAWWPIDMMELQQALAKGLIRNLAIQIPEGLHGASKTLNGFLDIAQKELGVRPERTVFGGFSQGAMVTADATLRSGRTIAGLVQLSGTLLAEVEWTPLMRTAQKGLPVFMSHGTLDPTLPFVQAEKLRDLFVESGMKVTWIPFRGDHAIPEVALAGLARFILETLD